VPSHRPARSIHNRRYRVVRPQLRRSGFPVTRPAAKAQYLSTSLSRQPGGRHGKTQGV
jgi:hypothetical protein